MIANLISNQNFIQKSNKKIPGRSVFNIHEENSDRELSINNTGMWIFTAEALSVIGMTSSERFRKNYIEYAKTLEQATIVAKDAIESGTKIIAEAASNAKGFMVKCIDDVNNFINALISLLTLVIELCYTYYLMRILLHLYKRLRISLFNSIPEICKGYSSLMSYSCR